MRPRWIHSARFPLENDINFSKKHELECARPDQIQNHLRVSARIEGIWRRIECTRPGTEGIQPTIEGIRPSIEGIRLEIEGTRPKHNKTTVFYSHSVCGYTAKVKKKKPCIKSFKNAHENHAKLAGAFLHANVQIPMQI